MAYVDSYDLSLKSHFKTGVLCLIGGLFGMHRFYAEKAASGCVMGGLFVLSLIGIMIHPVVWGIFLGCDILWCSVDFFCIVLNAFDDGNGKKISPENAVKDTEPLFSMLFFATLTIISVLVASLVQSKIFYIMCGIFAVFAFFFIVDENLYINGIGKSKTSDAAKVKTLTERISSHSVLKKTLFIIPFMAFCIGCVYYVYTTHIKNSPKEVNVSEGQPMGNIDDSISPSALPPETEDVVEEGFTTTLTAGHYTVGIDIPVGTYSFFSKAGSGNLYSSDSSINEIFTAEDSVADKTYKEYGLENFGTEEINNIYLSDGIIVTVTGTQQISAGCDDGLTSAMVSRNQDGLEGIELGYGLYAAGDDFPAGTYNVVWLEGNGNIQTDPFDMDTGINEIMGDISTETNSEVSKTINDLNELLYIKEFKNLFFAENDILRINDIKVKLVPSE